MTAYTITQIERAINYWRASGSGDDVVLNPHVRVLAGVYGHMIYGRLAAIAEADLTEPQVHAIRKALALQPATADEVGQ